MSDAKDNANWQSVSPSTMRLPVPGGWIYVVDNTTGENAVFVPTSSDALDRIALALEEIVNSRRPVGP